jgi:PAS domain S-box-containing protein
MQTQMTITHLELAEHLHTARTEIFNDWSDRLQHCFGADADRKLADADACRRGGEDLLGLLLISLKDRARISELSINPLSEKVRRIDYSISDYYSEASCLEQSLDCFLRSRESLTDRQILDATAMVRQRLNAITARILNECSQVYEHIVETSKACFCQTDLHGRIVFANREMERLTGEGPLVGKRLEDYFSDEDRHIVRDSIACSDSDGPGITRLTVVSAEGGRTVVRAEIGPLIIDDRNIGGYVHITDISIAEKQHKQLYDRALLGIAKVNRKGEILFANRSLLQMLNTQEYHGINIFDLLADESSRKWVGSQLESRYGWKSSEYPIELQRFGDREKVPVMISAFPETDLSGKRVVGSFAIVRCVLAQKIRHLIESHHEEKTLLQAVLRKLSLVVPFEIATVSMYSVDRKFACPIFSSNSHEEKKWQRRWWRMTPARIRWVSQEDIQIVEDIEQFLDQPDWIDLKREPDIQQLINEGFKSSITYPIFRDRVLVASVSLISKSPRFYNAYHKQQLLNLPIRSAVHMALYYHGLNESKFTSDLIMNLSNTGNDIEAVAQILVDAVAAHFKRQSVSLFKVNTKSGVVRLIGQAQTEAEYAIKKGYEQSADEGILGYVIRHGAVVNIGNVQAHEKFRHVYRKLADFVDIHSELCIPIPFGGALWLLNIEDEQIDAFSLEEQNELSRVMEEVRQYLENTWLNHFLEASLKSSSDAVLVTDCDGLVIKVNKAAINMLPIALPQEGPRNMTKSPVHRALMHITPLHLREIFANPEEADMSIETDYRPVGAIRLKRRTGGTIPVVLTRIDLQEDFGRTIFFASDLTAQQRLKQIENIEKIYHELAIQTKTPLSLAMGWIDRLKRRPIDPELSDTLDKSLRQLKKLEITYNRLALYAAEQEALPFNPTLFDMAEVIDTVKANLPSGEQSRITWKYGKGQGLIMGDIFQLRFCLETILSYLLRFATSDYKINLAISWEANHCVTEINGWAPRPDFPLGDTACLLKPDARAEADLALGRRLIDRIVARHQGTITVTGQGSGMKTFRLLLKVWEGGRHEA